VRVAGAGEAVAAAEGGPLRELTAEVEGVVVLEPQPVASALRVGERLAAPLAVGDAVADG
jgi:hypothetical protein